MGQERRDGQDRREGEVTETLPARPALPALVLCAAAFLVYSSLGLAAHRSLHSNAFDLSVFDYALWSTATSGPVAYVPMFRHSLFAQHFMPTLVLLSPLARLFDGPAWLFVAQAFFHAAAGFLLYRFARRHASNGVALALTAAFLFSRRAHGAATSVFYIESAEPLLIFGALLARESRRLVLYWLLVVLALGCKEDVALYLAVFGIVIAVVERDRRIGIATAALSVVWLAVSLGFAIPFWRGPVRPRFRRTRSSKVATAAWPMRRRDSSRWRRSAASSRS